MASMWRSALILTAVTALAGSRGQAVRPLTSFGAPPPTSPTAIDRAFQRLYSFDFPGALTILDDAATADPENPLVHSLRAATYQFREMARLHILETTFFLNDDNLVDGSAKLKPDPVARTALFSALDAARQRATARLSHNPDNLDALFALCMSAGVETDYTALVEGRTWQSMKLVPNTIKYADKLLARTPPFYDAYLNVGAVEYIVGDLPFFVRWFVHYDGIQGSKTRGIEQLRLAASHGRYYGPYARILLVLASLREKKSDEAEQLIKGLANEFPENPLFKNELARVQAGRAPASAR
jgi:hypothetical protein